MHITRDIKTQKGPAEWFTGDVYIDAVAAAPAPSRVTANLVHFMPGARTHWHRHPLSQTVFVTEGVGLCQRRGGPIEVIRPGDRGDRRRRGDALSAHATGGRHPASRAVPERWAIAVSCRIWGSPRPRISSASARC